jgi:hypothetical protein
LVLIAIFPVFAFSATRFEIISPKDKTQTKAGRLYIRGEAEGMQGVYANSVKLDIEKGGSFEAVALLRPGKNVLDVTGYITADKKETKHIRILKIVTFDDLEVLYSGRPHWAKQDVLAMATVGVIEGYPDNTFGPEKDVTRGELATWIARARGMKVYPQKEDVFFDVPKEHWRAPYVKAMVQAGYMRGISKDKFGIDEPIKRNEAAEIIAKAYKVAPSSAKKSYFNDVTVATKFAQYINADQTVGFVVGVPGKDKMFEPERSMKRGEAALLFASIKNIKELKAELYDFSKGYPDTRRCKIGTRPVIKKLEALPAVIAADGITPLKISAVIEDAQGKNDISQVWADLTPLGGPNNAKMSLVDSGAYELSFVMTSETRPGEKSLSVKALDKSGLSTDGSAIFTVTGK